MSIEGEDGREVIYHPSYCYDGDYYDYFGVEFRDCEDRSLGFFRDGDQPKVTFHYPGFTAFELVRADCEQLEGELHRESRGGYESGKVRGHLEIDCVAPNGQRVQGSLSFENCGDPTEDE